jgi:hypothetical protein
VDYLKRNKRILCSAAWLLLLTSCAPKCFYTDHNGIRPKSKSFFSYSRNPYRLQNTSVIDTNAVYVYTVESRADNVDGDSIADHVYFRFFSNGRLQCAITSGFPALEEINDIKTGAAGYYRIRNKKVYIQYIGTDGRLIEKKGSVEDGKLYLYYGIKMFDRPEVFGKKVVQGLSFDQPDW